ncbi:MAG: preprotein translocase subunit SecD [Acidobacteriaceae bacterium]|jgi:preprotein translocase subunit SecD|nr:preprotein translocase subunit SecD [Acidobacteriaceae bacterium]
MNRRLTRKTLFIVAIIFASAFAILRAPLRLGLDLRGGVSLILRIKAEGVSREQQREVVEQTRKILERRINAYGLSETAVQPYGSRGNELLVQLPGVSDPTRLKNLLQSPGVLDGTPSRVALIPIQRTPWRSTGAWRLITRS